MIRTATQDDGAPLATILRTHVETGVASSLWDMLMECAFVKTTAYFTEQVLRKRPYLQVEWCERALRQPARRDVQADGRVRYWVFIVELGKYLRVVTLEDGETVHNAFPDRNFKEIVA